MGLLKDSNLHLTRKYKCGPSNQITDVDGLSVGHVTIDHPEKDVHTGVTAILPHQGSLFQEKVMAGVSVINGFGKSAGLVQVEELGTIESPIIMTNTLSVGTGLTASVKYMLARNEDIGVKTGTVNCVVTECNDGALSDIRGLHVTEEDVLEALARSGVGAIDVIDNDRICESNLNRQILATYDTIDRDKTEVAAERIRSINPACRVEIKTCFYLPETEDQFDFSAYDYVVDAVDTVTAKISLVMKCREAGTPIISCMGTGNKMNPAMLQVADIYKTSVDPLARVMRRELKKRGVKKLKVVFLMVSTSVSIRLLMVILLL